jgi:predicted PurR-regulated permease PerM
VNLDKNNTKKIILILFSVVLFCTALLNLNKIWSAIKLVVSILVPVIIGLAVAYIMTPMAAGFEKWMTKHFKKSKYFNPGFKTLRVLSVTLAFLVVIAVIALLVIIIVPQARSAIAILSDTVPGFVNDALRWLNETVRNMGLDVDIFDTSSTDWIKMIETARNALKLDFAVGDLFGGVVGVASSLVGGIFNFLMGVLIGFRLMVQRESVGRFFRRFVRAYTSRNTANSIFRVVHLSAGAFRSFITGQLKEAVALGCMCYLGMIIFGFPYAGATSAVIGFCAIIPVFGAWIGGAAGALLSLTASPIKALLFIVFIVCLQAFDNNFVYPRIVGNSMNLPGLLVLLAVLIGGDIAGAAGMLLGVPLCSVMYTLINTSISNRLEKKKLEEKEEKAKI